MGDRLSTSSSCASRWAVSCSVGEIIVDGNIDQRCVGVEVRRSVFGSLGQLLELGGPTDGAMQPQIAGSADLLLGSPGGNPGPEVGVVLDRLLGDGDSPTGKPGEIQKAAHVARWFDGRIGLSVFVGHGKMPVHMPAGEGPRIP